MFRKWGKSEPPLCGVREFSKGIFQWSTSKVAISQYRNFPSGNFLKIELGLQSRRWLQLLGRALRLKESTFRTFPLWASSYSVSHETWQLVNSLECLIPQFVKLFVIPKTIIKVYIKESYYHKINFKVKYILAKYFLNEINCKQPLISNTVYGRRHSRLFTNCHVSWDTLYHLFVLNIP